MGVRPQLLQVAGEYKLAPALLTEVGAEAALHVLAEYAEALGLKLTEDATHAVYAMAGVLSDRRSWPLLLESPDLDALLAEVLDALEHRQGVAWLQ